MRLVSATLFFLSINLNFGSKKADTLSLKQNEVIAALKTNSSGATEILLESRRLLRENIQGQTDVVTRSSNEDHAATRSMILHALAEAQSAEMQLLQNLMFSTMHHRRVDIPEAHCKTFEWVFEDAPAGTQPWDNLSRWLKDGIGLFWINGKAGSGKSTLMRYLYDHNQTRQCLLEWAGSSTLEIGGHFFWNGGTLEQRSLSGILRSLLYQALQKRPDLVRTVFPEEWANISSAITGKQSWDSHWSVSALKAAFLRWLTVAPATCKTCYFIDGLDEYEGDHEDMALFFSNLPVSSHSMIKICLSSRPWIVFDEAYGLVPKLRLQDLTFLDIETYVNDVLKSHRRMKGLANKEPKHAAELIQEIIAKADGVFLWVTLVTKSLLNGLMNKDGIEDLRRRLRELPASLGALYKHMLKHVDPLYEKQAAMTFKIFQEMWPNWSSRAGSDITALELHLAIETTQPKSSKSYSCSESGISEEEIYSRCDELDIHLKSRCAGLLELRYMPSLSTVRYIHRTVKEFFQADEVQLAMARALESDFNANMVLTKLCAIKICRAVIINNYNDLDTVHNRAIWDLLENGMLHVRQAEIQGHHDCISIVEELRCIVLKQWNMNTLAGIDDYVHIQSVDFRQQRGPFNNEQVWQKSFLRMAVITGLCRYVKRRLTIDHTLLQGSSDVPILQLAFMDQRFNENTHIRTPIEMVVMLLDLGAEPNKYWIGNSPWQLLLTSIHQLGNFSRDDLDLSKECAHLMKLMLERGASPWTTCTYNHQLEKPNDGTSEHPHTVEAVIQYVFVEWLPEIAAELARLVSEKKKEWPRDLDTNRSPSRERSFTKRKFDDDEQDLFPPQSHKSARPHSIRRSPERVYNSAEHDQRRCQGRW